MPTGAFIGRRGRLFVGATSSGAFTYIGLLRSWEVNANRSMVDAGSFDSSGFGEFLPGDLTWTFGCEALLPSSTVTSQHDEVRDFLSSETRRWYRIMPSTAAASGNIIEGYGYVSDWSWNGTREQVALENFSFQGDGAYVLSTSV